MVKLRALDEHGDLPKMGEMKRLEQADGHALIYGRFAARGLGSFEKRLRVPLYSHAALQAAGEEALGFSPTEENCLGFAVSAGKREPKGYISLSKGVYTYELPLYDGGNFSPLGWGVRGYFPADTGFVAVAQRRTAFWVCLAIAAAAAFVVSYTGFSYGWSELPQNLWRLIQDAAGTVSGLFS